MSSREGPDKASRQMFSPRLIALGGAIEEWLLAAIRK